MALPPELLAELERVLGETPYGAVSLELSRSGGAITKASVSRRYPERFNRDNAAARAYVNRLLRAYQEARVDGEVTLTLLYRDGDLAVVTTCQTVP